MLYPHAKDSVLTPEVFLSPGKEYRCVPFWAWNGKMEKEELLRQIGIFEKMGMGGVLIHSRCGLQTPYLSDEFMELALACADETHRRGMACWLYDEDRWPSGSAGGMATRDRQFAQRYLRFAPVDSKEKRGESSVLLAHYWIGLNQHGELSEYRLLSTEERSDHESLWEASIEISQPQNWYNNQPYLDVLNPEAVRHFCRLTHERYAEIMGDRLGKAVPAIFTDEPQFFLKTNLPWATAKTAAMLPFTDTFCQSYEKQYGENLLETLPELFWELPAGRLSVTRYQYHEHVARLFSQAYASTIGKWCREHHILSTGHLMWEDTMELQNRAVGDAMRSYHEFQLPGIDILFDRREFLTAKQAASVVRQDGREGLLCEMYGVTGWDFDFRGHKLQGDWLAAMGVTTRVPHLSWYTMAGPGKRDYPATISEQSPWHTEYPLIENHFARLNTALTRGKCKASIGVIHPMESYWLHYGPQAETEPLRKEMDRNLANLTKWLLLNLLDFDFISESLLPEQGGISGRQLQVGQMKYNVILVPGCETLRASTIEWLEKFHQAGGRLIFIGQFPNYMSGVLSKSIKQFAAHCTLVDWQEQAILTVLESEREIDVRSKQHSRPENLLYQLRQDGENCWLFLCHAFPPVRPSEAEPEDLYITIRGFWRAEIWDTMTGNINPAETSFDGEKTAVAYRMFEQDSLLLKLYPGHKALTPQHLAGKQENDGTQFRVKLEPFCHFSLEEPNVLLLDQAEYSLDGEPWQPSEELLRLDDQLRDKLGWSRRAQDIPQPWTGLCLMPNEPPHQLSLRFTIQSRIKVSGAGLALESLKLAQLHWDGQPISNATDGWFVDRSFSRIPVPDFNEGTHELIVTYPYAPEFDLEWLYLTGFFGVEVKGSKAELVSMPSRLAFADLTRQSLPFYGGNVCYDLSCECDNAGLTVEIPQYKGALIRVFLDGEDRGTIVFAPYRLHLDAPAGKHTLRLKLYGTRTNHFGPLHNCTENLNLVNPKAWVTQGRFFSYEYQLKPTGLMVAPILYR